MEPRPENLEKKIMEEFTFLAHNLIPTTLKQAEWICHKIDVLTRKYPQLEQKLIEQSTLSETEKKEIATFIHKILAESEVKPRKTKNP